MARNVRWKQFFSNYQTRPTNDKSTLPALVEFEATLNLNSLPLPPDHPIEQYINFLVNNISDPSFSNSITNNQELNLSYQERTEIHSLKNNDHIIILPANKGSTTIVMNKKDYISEI